MARHTGEVENRHVVRKCECMIYALDLKRYGVLGDQAEIGHFKCSTRAHSHLNAHVIPREDLANGDSKRIQRYSG